MMSELKPWKPNLHNLAGSPDHLPGLCRPQHVDAYFANVPAVKGKGWTRQEELLTALDYYASAQAAFFEKEIDGKKFGVASNLLRAHFPNGEAKEAVMVDYMGHAVAFYNANKGPEGAVIPYIHGKLLTIAHQLQRSQSASDVARTILSLVEIGGMCTVHGEQAHAKLTEQVAGMLERDSELNGLFEAADKVIQALRQVRIAQRAPNTPAPMLCATIASLATMAQALQQKVRDVATEAHIADADVPLAKPAVSVEKSGLPGLAFEKVLALLTLFTVAWRMLGSSRSREPILPM